MVRMMKKKRLENLYSNQSKKKIQISDLIQKCQTVIHENQLT